MCLVWFKRFLWVSLSPAEIDQLRDILAEPFLAHTTLESHTGYNCIDEGMELAKMTPPLP